MSLDKEIGRKHYKVHSSEWKSKGLPDVFDDFEFHRHFLDYLSHQKVDVRFIDRSRRLFDLKHFARNCQKKENIAKLRSPTCSCYECVYEVFHNSEKYRVTSDLYEEDSASMYRDNSMELLFKHLTKCREELSSWPLDRVVDSYVPFEKNWGNL